MFLKSAIFQVLPFLRALSTPELAALEVRGKKWMDGCFFSLKVQVPSCCFFSPMKIFGEDFWVKIFGDFCYEALPL